MLKASNVQIRNEPIVTSEGVDAGERVEDEMEGGEIEISSENVN